MSCSGYLWINTHTDCEVLINTYAYHCYSFFMKNMHTKFQYTIVINKKMFYNEGPRYLVMGPVRRPYSKTRCLKNLAEGLRNILMHQLLL